MNDSTSKLLILLSIIILLSLTSVLIVVFLKQVLDFSVLPLKIKSFFTNMGEIINDVSNGSKDLLGITEEKKKNITNTKGLHEATKKEEDYIPSFSPEMVIALRNQHKGFTGVYIIYNASKGMYYVGQGQNVYQRCSNHFLGKGNGDIYADYKYGDDFYIEFVSLVRSGYDNLDDLERYYINRYDAIKKGYNKKKGNK